MAHNSILQGTSKKAQFAFIIYRKLMSREYVSYTDVMTAFNRKNNTGYGVSVSKEGYYSELKKAFRIIRTELKKYDENCIEEKKDEIDKRKLYYRYVGTSDDPLKELFRAYSQKHIEEMARFCKASYGLLPSSWISSFFSDIQDYLNIQNNTISSDSENIVKNIDLLPVFNKAINEKKVLRFYYHPFETDNAYLLTFHPQFIKGYNGRWFVFGKAEEKPLDVFNVAIDRIDGGIENVDGIDYIDAEKGFYEHYFDDIIGVTLFKDTLREEIRIRIYSKYTHGRIVTKPLHHSQQVMTPFTDKNGRQYSEVSLILKINNELISKLLSFGGDIEVVSPVSLRDKIRKTLEKQIARYLPEQSPNL